MARPHICFLTYLNRSGSTYLSAILDGYKDVAVSIEEDIPDNFTRGRCIIKNEKDLDHYLDQIYTLPKFSSWAIPREELKTKLQINSFPITFYEVLTSILELYFKGSTASVWIHKHGEYILHTYLIRNLFPRSKIIFITRDPRAIYSSQKKSLDSVKQLPMTKSVAHFAYKYLKYMEHVERSKKSNWFHLVRYEDLILLESKTIKKLLDFLEVDNKLEENTMYKDKIPENQAYLHSNIQSGPIASRIDQWRDSLSNLEVYLLQTTLKDYLNRYSYKSVNVQLTTTEYLKLLGLILYFISKRIGFRIKSFLNLK